MESNKKHGNGFLWGLILILAVVCGYFAYELYMKPDVKEETKVEEKTSKKETEKKNEEETKELDLNGFVVQNLVRLISLNKDCWYNSYYAGLELNKEVLTSDFDHQIKLSLAYLNLETNEIGYSDCSKYDVSKMSSHYKWENTESVYCEGTPEVISGKTMKLSMEEVFGENSYQPDSFSPRYGALSTIYRYYAPTDEFVSFIANGGGTCGSYDVKVTSATMKEDQIILSVSTGSNENNVEKEQNTYEFTFKKQNDFYYFYSIKRTK